MFRKVSLIIILSAALGAFLVLRPYWFRKSTPPRLEDRLPDADFIAKASLLDLARETSGMLFYHKIPFRDLFSHEFILSQSKQYGLNLQNPSYLFAEENGNWGALVEVADSSKIPEGIERLKKFITLKDTLIHEHKVYTYPEKEGYLTYDKGFLFIYKGSEFLHVFKKIIGAKRGDVTPTWKAFLQQKHFRNEKLIIYTNWKRLKEYGIQTALFAHDSDSTSFSLLAYAKSIRPIKVSSKGNGLNFKDQSGTTHQVNIHLNPTDLTLDKTDPIYQWLAKMAQKINFPLDYFLAAWTGDLSFKQGGIEVAKEAYVETEYDENFNPTEVKKIREIMVPGYALLMSVNEKGPSFFNRLLQKGLLRKENQSYRFLFSPLLTFTQQDNYYIFHSGSKSPEMISHSRNYGHITHDGTQFDFKLDRLTQHELFGTVYIPVKRLISKNRFLH